MLLILGSSSAAIAVILALTLSCIAYRRCHGAKQQIQPRSSTAATASAPTANVQSSGAARLDAFPAVGGRVGASGPGKLPAVPIVIGRPAASADGRGVDLDLEAALQQNLELKQELARA